MAKKQMLFKTKGMNQDLSVSAFNPEFSFENMNLRLSTNEGNTLMSWVNEKGTAELTIVTENNNGQATQDALTITGTPIGTAIINSYLILFTKGTTYDYIYRLKYTDNTKTALHGKAICQSISQYMTLSTDHPLETLVSYESDTIQKVYWVDGINQPRVINVCKDYGVITSGGYCKFDFVPELQLQETVTVQKLLGATGMFAPGVIQYAFTYYNKNGQESNIFYTTPLYYISYKDRGASPEDKVENAFKIKVKGVDRHFEYLRIYSIQRTSVNATPICKRIQDIELNDSLSMEDGKYVAYYTDNGFSGNTVDPTELLYKGGEIISAGTLEQKDGTLFLGDIEITRNYLNSMKSDIQSAVSFTKNSKRIIFPTIVSSGDYGYANQLTSLDSTKTKSVPCGGFKTGDFYRCGIQFQHKSGKWSEPIFINDVKVEATPWDGASYVELPRIVGRLSLSANNRTKLIKNLGYKKVRPVVVFPEMQDRVTICQGVANPTMYTKEQRNNGHLDAQASWFFRSPMSSYVNNSDKVTISPFYGEATTANPDANILPYTSRQIDGENPVNPGTAYDPDPSSGFKIRQVEIQGDFESDNQFRVDPSILTLNSPDIEFNDQLSVMDFTGLKGKKTGEVHITKTLSDIDIQTESPTVSNSGGGFVHKAFSKSTTYGIVAGLFYDDYIVDDCLGDDNHLGAYPNQRAACKYMVYPWQGSGSLNNDMNRPANKGTATAILKKKIISNLRYAIVYNNHPSSITFPEGVEPQLYNSEEATVVKLKDTIYQGNIDTSLVPDNADGQYFCLNGDLSEDIKTGFNSNSWFKTWSMNPDIQKQNGLRYWNTTDKKWYWCGDDIGDEFVDLDMRKNPVRMKYKSTPHIVFKTNSNLFDSSLLSYNQLPLVELYNENNSNYDPSNPSSSAYTTIFGGRSMDALRENTWVPCGESVPLSATGDTTFYYEYGDTYFQRWDCLKTYPFTREDPNQIVEIISFPVETRVNIDGRYDRNRGQASNINMSPTNFNLLNQVYSQVDNFFSYKIQDDDFYKDVKYPNQVTWTKEKNAGADVDNWTNVTLASVLELDGDKGKVNKLIRLNNQLFCFQDTGISHILYNENVQIESTQGVPIEIANSGKVQGKDYKSGTIGCSNKWSMVSTPNGIYFMDSNDKSIYLFNRQLNNVSASGGFNAWCKNNIPASSIVWTPTDFNTFKACYDKLNQDVLFINKTKALAFSEKLGAFTSFYSYENTPFFCNLDDTGIWIKANGTLWKHQAGGYCDFFSTENYDGHKPYWMTLVGNPEPQMDKIFTNLEFRACVESDGDASLVATFDDTFGSSFQPQAGAVDVNKFTPYLPFTHLETWDEYQHGYTKLSNKNGHSAFTHHTADMDSSLKRKFRIWRCDIPRNNCNIGEPETGVVWPYSTDETLGISRYSKKPQDRMRNPWLYLKLQKDADTDKKVEIHDIVMTYFT